MFDGRALKSACERVKSIILNSSTISSLQSNGFSSFLPKLKPGAHSNNLWTVLAGIPDSSCNLIAARPVGAQTNIDKLYFSNSFIIRVTVAVLPTPGPPVTTRTFSLSANLRTCSWPFDNPSIIPSKTLFSPSFLSISASGCSSDGSMMRCRSEAIPCSCSNTSRLQMNEDSSSFVRKKLTEGSLSHSILNCVCGNRTTDDSLDSSSFKSIS
mmetsp:Transcript_3345/g.4138  ORF Transcript_3345/g.4138 Transcript_3345/m.4138 type:complete len:212 (+) Transcript_3345:102-737(+)